MFCHLFREFVLFKVLQNSLLRYQYQVFFYSKITLSMCGFIEIRAKFVPKNSNVLKNTNLNIYINVWKQLLKVDP